MQEKKEQLRSQLLSARAAMSPEDRAREDAALIASVSYFLRSRKVRRVAAYVPTRGEPGGRLLLDVVHAEVPSLILPISLPDGNLDWASYEGRTNLSTARFGIPEPVGTRLGTTALESCDIVLAPALACNPEGYRLGKGGGFFDRALASCNTSSTTVAALLYNGEIRDDIFIESHDQPVDVIITPTGVRNLRHS